ncbi:hypothetical protein [Streptomyces sp. NPDC058812]|uniref:hypothetical protein n=1 Tax=unclassified Streptomyces TaxID=2593676 RepID=UPI0036B6BF2E
MIAGHVRGFEGVGDPVGRRAARDPAGACLGKRELRALVANPCLQVYEDPKGPLTCHHDEFTVLYNPDRDRAGDGARHTPLSYGRRCAARLLRRGGRQR